MTPGKVHSEMRPRGRLRPIFQDLASARGAYVIFSSDDVSHAGHQRRLQAIADSLLDLAGADRIHVDFLGADRIARWTNQHLGVAVWLLGQVGRGLGGWRPAGDWSAPGASVLPYLLDDSRRAILRGKTTDVRSALVSMREILASPGGIARLVGLSGMGKTRLAEALFDPRIDAHSTLPSDRAIYGDAGLDLSISAALLAEQLVLSEVDSVIIVDNCPSRAHAQLSEIVSRKSSRSSLLTIDYDIESDMAPGEFIRLDSNSEPIISHLLSQRCPDLTVGERHHLAEFSGGNARIALKVAEGAEGGDLSKLRDGELLDRLFRSGRRDEDPGLRQTAELASLVYAFYVEDADRNQAEHRALAEIAGVATDTFYRQIATLLDWGVVQQRGPQRAVMPPPLANMLAAPFIRRSDPARLLQQFIGGPPRLLASFARRLGELHAEPVAERIARSLLANDGALGNVDRLNGVMLRGFALIAPAAPDAALEAIERMLARRTGGRTAAIATKTRLESSRLLAQIAFDEVLFERSITALVELLVGATEGGEKRKLAQEISEKFRPFGSYTRAPQSSRLMVIDLLQRDSRFEVRQLGMQAAGRMLDPSDAWYRDSRFGNRSLADEWRPKGPEAEQAWYQAAYQRVCDAPATDPILGNLARTIVCGAFRQLAKEPTTELAVAAMRAVKPDSYWAEGWQTVAQTIQYFPLRTDETPPPAVTDLELELRPTSPDELFETFVWRDDNWTVNRLWQSIWQVKAPAETLGRQFAQNDASISDLLEQSVCAEPHNRLTEFSASFARHTNDLERLWKEARAAFASGPRTAPQIQMLAGIIAGAAKAHKALADAWLDDVVTDPVLVEHLIALQLGLGLDRNAVRRIVDALSSQRIRPDQVSLLVNAKNVGLIPASSLADFLRLIFLDGEGVYPAIALLCDYFNELPESSVPDDNMIELGKFFLKSPRTYAEDSAGLPGAVAWLAHIVLLSRINQSETVAGICAAVLQARPTTIFVSPSFQALGGYLTQNFPGIVLDRILSNEVREDVVRLFFGDRRIDDKVALSWLQEDPPARSLLLATVVTLTGADRVVGVPSWSKAALALIEAAAHPVAVLRAFERRVFSGTGSLTSRLIEFRMLIKELAGHSDERVRRWSQFASQRVERHIARWDNRERAHISRFE
jgi:hypothetical protein